MAHSDDKKGNVIASPVCWLCAGERSNLNTKSSHWYRRIDTLGTYPFAGGYFDIRHSLFGIQYSLFDTCPTQTDSKVIAMVAIGAVVGGGIAAATGGNGWTGAAIGAVAGGVIGNIKGKEAD